MTAILDQKDCKHPLRVFLVNYMRMFERKLEGLEVASPIPRRATLRSRLDWQRGSHAIRAFTDGRATA